MTVDGVGAVMGEKWCAQSEGFDMFGPGDRGEGGRLTENRVRVRGFAEI